MIDSYQDEERLIRLRPSEPSAIPAQDPMTQHLVQDRIGRQLRSMYSDLMEQPLPAPLLELLNRLEDTKPGGHE